MGHLDLMYATSPGIWLKLSQEWELKLLMTEDSARHWICQVWAGELKGNATPARRLLLSTTIEWKRVQPLLRRLV